MGLKTTNYTIKNLGITISEAYALLIKLSVYQNNIQADFGVFLNREDSNKLSPLEIKSIAFTWDRCSNLAEMAYENAKILSQQVWDPFLKTYVQKDVPGPFFDWQDDIVVIDKGEEIKDDSTTNV